MGFVRAVKVAEVPAGTVREFHVEGRRLRWRMWAGRFTR